MNTSLRTGSILHVLLHTFALIHGDDQSITLNNIFKTVLAKLKVEPLILFFGPLYFTNTWASNHIGKTITRSAVNLKNIRELVGLNIGACDMVMWYCSADTLF